MKRISILNKNIGEKFIKIALAGMLLFTMLINPAVSYQQAMTNTSKNVYAIGDGVKVNFNIIQESSSNNKLVYPNEFIPYKPVINNNGDIPAWIVMAIKIPAATNGFEGYSGLEAVNISPNTIDNPLVYPAFYTVPMKKTDMSYDYSDISNSQRADNLYPDEIIEDDLIPINCVETTDHTTGWTLLDINKDYAHKEDGYLIYYFGYDNPLNVGANATSPFEGLMSMNFENKQFYSLGGKRVVKYNYKEFNVNSSVELRLFVMSSEIDDNGSAVELSTAWNIMKDKFSVFGNTTVVNSTFQCEYPAGRNNVNFDITKDVQEIRVTNVSTNQAETFDINNNSNVTIINPDDHGLCSVKISINFESSGVYEVSAKAEAGSEFINPVNFGYINVN